MIVGIMTKMISEMMYLSDGYVQNLLFSAFPMVTIRRQAVRTVSTSRDHMAATRAHGGPARRGLPLNRCAIDHTPATTGMRGPIFRVASSKNVLFHKILSLQLQV